MQASASTNRTSKFIEGAGWLLSILVPIALYFVLISFSLNSEVVIFLSILSSAIVMWIFRIVPEYLPGIFVIVACASLGLVPSNIILSGFSSETFMMVFSVLCMTILIARSGLISRFILILLRALPQKEGYFNSVFFISFSLLTPLIPSIVSRTQLVAHSLTNFINILKLETKNEHITKLTANAFFGTSLFSSIFLSASLMNFVILALLPLQEQQRFQLVGWFQASLAAAIVMIVAYMVIFAIFFRGKETIKIPKQLIIEQLERLGPVSKDEWISLATVAAFFIGMMTFPYHKISPTWIAFGLAYILLSFNVLNREDIQTRVDWSFLMFMASVVGIASIATYFDLSGTISTKLQSFIYLVGTSQEALIGFLTISTIFVRFFLPIGATVALLIPIFISLAGLYGISCWSACFVSLMMVDMWFFPYQCIFYTEMRESFSGQELPFQEKKFLIFNAVVNIVRILAIFASFYYWQWLGL
ncbi:MAG: anion permease [Alphaproteobacteria bacterium]|nr:anion permease [Alphaproteobacteria bacterium]